MNHVSRLYKGGTYMFYYSLQNTVLPHSKPTESNCPGKGFRFGIRGQLISKQVPLGVHLENPSASIWNLEFEYRTLVLIRKYFKQKF